MTNKGISRLKCELGYHHEVTVPHVAYTLHDGRQVIVSKVICTRCDYCNELTRR